MDKRAFIEVLKRLAETGIEVHEQVGITEVDGTPVLDRYGGQVYQDVVIAGDGRIYIDRDGNEEESEADLVALLSGLDSYLTFIIAALEADQA